MSDRKWIAIIFWINFLWLIYYAFLDKDRLQWLRTLILINIALIAIYWTMLIQYWYYTSNVGSVFYWFVPVIIAILIKCYWEKATLWGIAIMVPSLLIFVLLSFYTSKRNPGIDWNSQIKMLIASFVAFVLSQSIFVILLRKLWYVPALVIMQTIDSIIFYLTAFGSKGILTSEVLITGLIVKIIIWIMLRPIYYLSIHKEH